MKDSAKVVQNTVKSHYMQNVIKKKKWTEQQAAEKVNEFLVCKEPISLFVFMEKQK